MRKVFFKKTLIINFFKETVNSDMFHRLLLQSDPLISLTRGFSEKKKQDYTEEMKSLFSQEEVADMMEIDEEDFGEN